MSQSFIVQSEKIRDKLNTLLPSQNRNSIGVDLTGSTQIIPIIDLTEVASGSNIREDLQTALSLGSITSFNVAGATTTVVTTTGYFRIFGVDTIETDSGGDRTISHQVTDGTTTKIIRQTYGGDVSTETVNTVFDYTVFLKAGDSFQISSSNAACHSVGSTRQIATVTGELVNP